MEFADPLEIARALLEQPTAPFHEEAVRREIERRLTGLPGVELRRDGFGNVIARWQRGEAIPRFAFAAHMDHPGFVGGDFLGGVPAAYRAKQPPTRDFGGFAMWDLPAFELREGRIYSRACDDLIGCATIVATLQQLAHGEVEGACYGLFTRAEEIGFGGAIAMAREAVVPREVTIVSLETSSERAGLAKMGQGVVIRVGDRTSIFDSIASAVLQEIAREKGIAHQRSLMSGGTCEATAFQLYGYKAAGLCVALGNYHNCAPDEVIAPEYVSVEDYLGMIALCRASAELRADLDVEAELRRKLEANFEEHRRYFRALE